MRARQSGFVLIAMSVAMLLMLAMIGMAFDFGRIYIARNEAQVFTDAAAMTAAVGIGRAGGSAEAARAEVAALPMRWNLGTQPFTGVTVEFSEDGRRWTTSPDAAQTVEFARVTAPANEVEILFLRAVGGPDALTVPARSVARVRPVRLVE